MARRFLLEEAISKMGFPANTLVNSIMEVHFHQSVIKEF